MSPEQEARITRGLRAALNGRLSEADQIWQEEIAKAAGDSANGAEIAGRVASLTASLGLLDKALAYDGIYAHFAKSETGVDPLIEMSVAHNIGAKLFEAQRLPEAEPFYRRAVTAARAAGDNAAIALHSGNLAVLLLNSGKPADAIPFFTSSIEDYAKCGDTDYQAWMLTSLGNAQEETGDPTGAMASYEWAARLANNSQDRRLLGAVLNNLASAKAGAGEIEIAIGIHEEALGFALLAQASDLEQQCEQNLIQDLLRVFPQPEVPAWFAISRGRVRLKLEDHAGAEQYFKEAAELAETAGIPRLRAAAWGWLAGELMRNKQLAGAEAAFWTQVEAASAAGNARTVTDAYGKIAGLLMRRGEYALALRCWNLQDVQRQKQPLTVSEALDRIEAFLTLGNWRAAERLLAAAQRTVEDTNDAVLTARWKRSLGEAARLEGKLEVASNHLTAAFAESVAVFETAVVMDVALSLARLFLAQGQFSGARGHAREALDWAVRAGDETRKIAARCLLAAALLAEGDFDRTLEEYAAAAQAAEELGHSPYLGLSLAGQAETRMWRGDFAAAHSLLENAIAIERYIAQGLDDENSISLLRQQQRTYELFQSCLVGEGRSDEALLASERLKGNALAHLLERRHGPGARARELKASFQDAALDVLARFDINQAKRDPALRLDRARMLRVLGMTALRRVELEALTITDIQGICQEQAMTIVSYSWLGSGELYAWIISKDAVHFQPLLTIGDKSLEELVARFRATLAAQRRDSFEPALAHGEDEAAVRQLCREGHSILIAPLASFLPETKGSLLAIVPSGALFGIPFGALTGASGAALADHYALVTAPSIRFFRQSERLGAAEAAGAAAVVIGNPNMPDLRRWMVTEERSLPSLPASEHEASRVCAALKIKGYQTIELIGKDATKTALLEALQRASIAHLATHSLLDQQYPSHSAIVLSPAEGEAGFLTVSEVSQLDTHLDLAVLSACRTGAGEVTADGVAGLARAWHVSGARSVVFSLWSVGDESTSVFMQSFYQNALETGNYAAAMCAASIETRRSFPNPLDWAGFALSGQPFK